MSKSTLLHQNEIRHIVFIFQKLFNKMDKDDIKKIMYINIMMESNTRYLCSP